MATQFYLPASDAERNLWLQNFSSKLSLYYTRYGITGAELADVQNGSADFSYRLNVSNQWHAYAGKWTAYKNELRNGTVAGAAASNPPELPIIPAAPFAVMPGIFARVTSLVARIKSNPAYTEADGRDLGIISSQIMVDYATLKPHTSIRTGSGGMPEIVWDKQGMDGVAIYKNSGNGFVFYDLDNHPNYQDKHPLPVGGQSAVWQYKLIYRQNDAEVGLWSDVLAISVGS